MVSSRSKETFVKSNLKIHIGFWKPKVSIVVVQGGKWMARKVMKKRRAIKEQNMKNDVKKENKNMSDSRIFN